MESNREQTMADIENAFEQSKAKRFDSKNRWESAKARLHMELIARREAGQNLTVEDIKATKALAIDNVDYVRDAYLAFVASDADYRSAKVKWEAAKRNYWDSKQSL